MLTSEQKTIMRKILYAVESGGQVYGNQNYSAFAGVGANTPNETAITIGAGQWYAGEAKRLLKKIKDVYPSAFAKLDTENLSADLSKDWTNYGVTSTSAKGKCIIKIISSSEGIACQDALMEEQISEFDTSITATYGEMAADGMMECINIIHQGGASALKRILAKTKKPYTADTIYTALCTDPADKSNNNQVGDYTTRQSKVYQMIKVHVTGSEVASSGGDWTVSKLKQAVIDAYVQYMVGIANDNTHGYSQAVRSLYNYTNPTSFDCSSLTCTAIQYAFDKYGITPTPKSKGCSYTGNMDALMECGFAQVAVNQTAHSEMQKGDIEINWVYHVAVAVDGDNIVHARSSEGTTDTKDNSGNEIRVQPWYEYSHGWSARLRFTGRNLDLESVVNRLNKNGVPSDTTGTTGGGYMFSVNLVKNGSTGNDVKLLQRLLKSNGFRGSDKKVLTLDGECGKNTVYAIKKYQTKHGLDVDGECGENTWKSILLR